MTITRIIIAILLLSLGAATGWYLSQNLGVSSSEPSSERTLTPTRSGEINRVVAQGRLLPRTGIVSINMPPTQRIERFLVKEGDEIVQGETELVTFIGQSMTELQRQLVDAQNEDAIREIDQKIQVAEGNLASAQQTLRLAELRIEQLKQTDLLAASKKQLQAAKQKLERIERLANDPITEVYLSQHSISDQQLEIEQAEIKLNQAIVEQENAMTAAELNADTARLAVRQAETGLNTLLDLRQENRTLQLAQQIAAESASSTRVMAPITGVVLKVTGAPGETIVQSPIIQVGDLSEIVCRAEVVDRLIPKVKVGSRVTINSPVFETSIKGEIESIGRTVGNARLVDPNPLSLVDRRTVDVTIKIDSQDQPAVRRLLNLQVAVEIDLAPTDRINLDVPQT